MPDPLAIVRVDVFDPPPRIGTDLFRRVAEAGPHALVPGHLARHQVPVPNGVVRRLPDQPVTQLTLPQGVVLPLAVNVLGDLIGQRGEVGQDGLGERLAAEHRQHADESAFHLQRIPGEGDHTLPLGPGRVADVRVVPNVVSEVRATVPGDATDLELAHFDTAVRTIPVCVLACTGLQLQHTRRLTRRAV